MKRYSLFSLLIFCVLVLNSCAVRVESKDTFAKIDSLLQVKSPRSFSGVFLISKGEKIIYWNAKGFINQPAQRALNIDDHFSSMSIAKQITATLVMLEVEKGTVNLNSPIRNYLPDLKYDWANKVTVHQLLNNSSGIDAWEFKENLLFEPGTQFKYSNIGYATLGKILENVIGKPYGTLVNDLFKKIGMFESFYPSTTSKLVPSYYVKKDGSVNLVTKFPFDKEFFPGSHLILTVKDLSKWNFALHNGKILKDDSYQKMIHYNITNVHELFGEKAIGYGYGLRINDKAEVFEIGHTGFSPPAGFTAVNLYYPKNKISVIVLENTATEESDNAYFFEKGIRDIMVKSKLTR